MARRTEAAALDARILAAIARFQLDDDEFETLARDLFVHQITYNAAYAAFAHSLGFDRDRLPAGWRQIPAVPSLAFKESSLATFDPERAALVFETSGTTGAETGRHYFENAALYEAALLAAFDRFILADDGGVRLRYLLLVPQRKSSSLGHMMATVARERGDGAEGWFLDDDGPRIDAFLDAAERAHRAGMPVCVAGTAFAFVALLDALDERGLEVPTRPGSRIMETGGFKGRSRSIERGELYAALARRLRVPQHRIVAEYGMTELSSQYYDAPSSRAGEERVKIGPPWLRPLVIRGDGREAAPGEIGVLRHIDLANRGSVLAIETEDLALRVSGEGFVLLGREPEARPRGCSLDAEDLVARRR